MSSPLFAFAYSIISSTVVLTYDEPLNFSQKAATEQAKLESLEVEIANSRRFYNANVKEMNNKVEMFPSNIVAKWFKFEKQSMFELDNIEERKNVKVEF